MLRRVVKLRAGRLFSTATTTDIDAFRSIVGDAGIITEEDEVSSFQRDWMRKFQGAGKCVLRPKTTGACMSDANDTDVTYTQKKRACVDAATKCSTAEVSQLLQHCNARKLAVVPQGGNTGLVGGSVPIQDEIVLSMSRMNEIRSFDEKSGVLTAEAGCILESLDSWLQERGHCMPLDLGAKGSCHLGGNISTNAGGMRLLRYGSLHGSVLGLEVVQADGTVLDLLSTLRKDNVGVDLKHLFIGGEGTLGIVTAASVATPRQPLATNVAVLGCATFSDTLEMLELARTDLTEVLSAIEFWDAASMTLLESSAEELDDPLDQRYPFYVLVVTQGADASHDGDKLDKFLQNSLSHRAADMGVVAADSGQVRSLWRLRETIPVSLNERGATFKYDVSLRHGEMYSLVDAARERLKPVAEQHGTRVRLPMADPDPDDVVVVGYGHIGDGNLHLNVSVPEGNPLLEPASVAGAASIVEACLEPWVYEYVMERRGSISAEHGIGRTKAKYLPQVHSPAVLSLMRSLKQQLDPNGILNPGKGVHALTER